MHTPGPWKYEEPGWDGLLHLKGANGKVVATFLSEPAKPSDTALLAAAPELLEACKSLLTVIDVRMLELSESKWGKRKREAERKAKAALAKARGEEGEENV